VSAASGDARRSKIFPGASGTPVTQEAIMALATGIRM